MSEKKENNSVPFYPDHLKSEAKVALGVGVLVIFIGVLGLFFPVGLGAPADPMDTPLHVKPEWYFLFLYQLLQFIPKTLGAISPVIIVLLLALWPLLDSKPDQTKKPIRLRILVSVVVLLIIIALTIWGEVS
jgi:quinol-cytochrome oxidoreductase complex cytochrome b subunit